MEDQCSGNRVRGVSEGGSLGRRGQGPKPTHDIVPIAMLSGMQYVKDYSNEARLTIHNAERVFTQTTFKGK